MDEKFVSYLAFESVTARQERTIKRLWILIIVLIISLLGTNGAWLWYESQFVDELSVEQNAEWEDGGHIILNATGEVSMDGQSASESN